MRSNWESVFPSLFGNGKLILVVFAVFATLDSAAQMLEVPDRTFIGPNVMGPVSKIVPSVPRNYTSDYRFALGEFGIFSLNQKSHRGPTFPIK